MFRMLGQGKFRSRTEQRVAEWLDRHDIKWSYEPEGFQVGPEEF